ncbi:glycine betaine transporter subunit; membrane component of ABC superfamily [Mesorhizobium plurifarium]|uniref:Glycine betaine transporter subunit membrane component of ABC superfamily n=1 Tax=Mesorhizobium plurifarium TaxID=69974 RepID=A0A090ECX1_MESPL|nr:glycine betaine transporter subunit; membrane component of ABC superfamily [Mesorhizobium plurifarium]
MDQFLNPFDHFTIPFGHWAENFIALMVSGSRDTLVAAKLPVQAFLEAIRDLLLSVPPSIGILVVTAAGYLLGGARLAALGFFCLVGIGLLELWDAAMTTLAIALAAVAICVVIGLPLGILTARSETFHRLMRPILDLMQATPSFVYLVPVVMLFGIGDVPGVIVTCLFAVAPMIRLTNLGIRQVRADLVEAARAFGASDLRVLYGIQLPIARPTILAGLNQTVLMSLSMAVVASMISVAGLGRVVLEGIGRLDFGRATIGGLGIVLTAILVDRYVQALGAARPRLARGSA